MYQQQDPTISRLCIWSMIIILDIVAIFLMGLMDHGLFQWQHLITCTFNFQTKQNGPIENETVPSSSYMVLSIRWWFQCTLFWFRMKILKSALNYMLETRTICWLLSPKLFKSLKNLELVRILSQPSRLEYIQDPFWYNHSNWSKNIDFSG